MQSISKLLRKNSFDSACNFANHIKVYFSPLKIFLQKNIKKDLEKYTCKVLLNNGSLFLWMLLKTRFPELKIARRIVNDKLQTYLNSSTIIIRCDCKSSDCDVKKMQSFGEKDLRFWIMNFTDIDFKLVEKLLQIYDQLEARVSNPFCKFNIFENFKKMLRAWTSP